MREGWHHDEYLILFSEVEAARATAAYDIAESLDGFTVIGLHGWDDFIVRDRSGAIFTVPTVPAIPRYLTSATFAVEGIDVDSDPDLQGRIKWYVKPVVFGGDPSAEENLIWITHEQHIELVKWWNRKYRDVTAGIQEHDSH